MAVRVLEVTCKSILTRTSGFLAGYTHTLQPYIGCAFRCSYCYVQAMPVHLYHGGSWGDYVDAKVNAPERLKVELGKLKAKGKSTRIFMGSATDPYQGIEAKYGITRRCLEVFADMQPDHLVVQTRSPLVRRDFDLLTRIDRVVLNMTLETHDETVRRNITAHAPSVPARLRTLDAARNMGITVQVTISPMLPNDPDIFVATIRDRCHRVIIDTFFDGDGSGGKRTERLQIREMYERLGYQHWYNPDAHLALVDALLSSLGPERIGYSKEGFNQVNDNSKL